MISAAALSLILNAAQVHWLNIAYNEGALYGLPKYTQAIILVESSACLHKRGDDGHSLGCGQLQIATAKIICRCKVTRNTLINNNARNIRISAAFLNECFIRFWPDKRRAILCYNVGEPQASKASASEVANSNYVFKVEQTVKALQSLPQDTQ